MKALDLHLSGWKSGRKSALFGLVIRIMAGFAVLYALSLAFSTHMAFAQSVSTEQTASEVQAEANTQAAQDGSQNLSVATPNTADKRVNVGASDDVISQKIKAAQEAQNEAYEALRTKFEDQTQTVQSVVADSPQADQNEATVQSKSGFSLEPENLKATAIKIREKILGWLTSPPFLAQVGAIALIWLLLAPLLARQLRSKTFFLRDPPKEGDKLLIVRKYIYEVRELVRPVLNIALLALAAIILKPSLGQDWLVKLAQGLAVVFLIYSVIKQFAPNELVRKVTSFIAIPLALLAVFGYFDDLLAFLDSIALGGGDNPISVLTLIKLAIFGSLFFYLGNFSNKKGQTALRSQESLDVGIREIIAKFLQIGIFGAAAVMAMSAAGIGMGGLVVILSAMSLGVGLGLQPIAANFVSGMIILFDRSVRVGDFVSLDDGREGFVEAINMRSTTVETTDGKDIMVPNTTFIENSYENWTHKDPRQRYEVYFTVAYDTDIDKLEDIVIPVFEKHPSVLNEPEEPDLELREFGANGINFAVEFWCSGIDDGPNKFTSDLNFEIWRALKANKIRMPLPQTEVRLLK